MRRVYKVVQGHKAVLVPPAYKDPLVVQARRALKVIRERRAQLAQQAALDHKEAQERQD